MNQNQNIRILDLNFMQEDTAIASFLIPSGDGLILIETGPETTFENLQNAIEASGFHWSEVKHVLLTHIHFDHAGAAWKFAENNAKIYVHPVGLPHLQNPERLWNSAKMIYKDDMDRLWGAMKPIKKELLIPADDGDVIHIGELEFKVHYTPGHAIHHNAYELDTVVFTGDVAGVVIHNGPVVPPCPPPDIDLGSWKESIEKLRKINPEYFYLTHFGKIEKPQQHLTDLEKILEDWAAWMKPHFDAGTDPDLITPEFIAYTNRQLQDQGVSDADIERYNLANPSWMSVRGLLRYWKLKEEGRL